MADSFGAITVDRAILSLALDTMIQCGHKRLNPIWRFPAKLFIRVSIPFSNKDAKNLKSAYVAWMTCNVRTLKVCGPRWRISP